MSEVTVSIHNHHDRILRDLREQSAVFAAEPSPANSARLLTLLRDDLLKHAAGEERELYPRIDRIMKAAGANATASMAVVHEFIAEYVDWIEAALRSLPGATGARRDLLLAQLKRYLTQLEAVLNLHLEKEERLLLPMLERYVPVADQRRMIAAMRGESASKEPAARVEPPRRRNQPMREKNSRARAVTKKSIGHKAHAKNAPRNKRGRRR